MRRNTLLFRIAVLVLLLAGIALAAHYRHAIDPVAIRNGIAANPLSPLLFIVLQVAASLLFVPRTVLAVAAGLLFGFVWGAVLSMAGAMAGAAAGFAMVRWFGIGGALDAAPRFGALVRKAEHGGWRAVAMVRLTPVPHSVANSLLAMTAVPWRDYLIGSFFGMLPMTLAQVDIGTSGGSILRSSGEWIFACLALAAGLGATFLLKRAAARRGSQDGGDTLG